MAAVRSTAQPLCPLTAPTPSLLSVYPHFLRINHLSMSVQRAVGIEGIVRLRGCQVTPCYFRHTISSLQIISPFSIVFAISIKIRASRMSTLHHWAPVERILGLQSTRPDPRELGSVGREITTPTSQLHALIKNWAGWESGFNCDLFHWCCFYFGFTELLTFLSTPASDGKRSFSGFYITQTIFK